MTDRSRRLLAIETKVDSDARREQMEGTAGEGNFAALFAVGLTSLQISDVRPGAWGGEAWTVIDLPAWVDALRNCGVTDSTIGAYMSCVEREHRNHEQARAAAASGTSVCTDAWRIGNRLLAWAWMAEIADAVTKAGHGTFWCHTRISGPVMYWHEAETLLPGENGYLYLDFMVEKELRRRLVVKALRVPSDKRVAVWEAAGAAVSKKAVRARSRPAAAQTGSFKIAAIDLDGMTTDEILPLALDLRAQLAEIAATLI